MTTVLLSVLLLLGFGGSFVAGVARRLSPASLERVLLIVILGSAVRVWWDLLGPLME